MNDLTFQKFPKIKRLNRECVITEKLDGTNAQILFDINGNILCGSRNREITPQDDNFGFAAWAYDNRDKLFEVLGEGRHYGEWWGSGIQRGYGLRDGVKYFSLFNTTRWLEQAASLAHVPQLRVIPELYRGVFDTKEIGNVFDDLRIGGSMAAPLYMNPEGIIIYHTQIREQFKVTYEHDEHGKQEC